MAMRMSGLMSGMDTESIISQLVEARRVKVDNKVKAQTKLEWKQDAWKELNTKLKNLQSKFVNTMRFSSAYAKKTTKVSDSNAASVITGDSAVNGVQELTIDKLAKTGYLTGGEVSRTDGADATAMTKMSELGFSGEASFSVKSKNGETKSINITENTTISDVMTELKEYGLNANFDAKNQRLFISSKTSGEDADFEISATTADGNDALAKLGLQEASYYEELKSKTIDSYTSQIDAEVTRRANSYAARYAELKKQDAEYLELQNDNEINEISGKTSEELADYLKTLQDGLADETKTDEEKADIQKRIDKIQRYQELQASAGGRADEEEELDRSEYVVISYDPDSQTATAVAKDKLEQEVTAAYEARINEATNIKSTAYASKIDGSDAEITLNGATFKNNTNVFEINGLTITANEANPGKKITLTTQTDTDGIYDMVKNFIKEYNSIINEIDKLYNADSAKGYEPLTDEEKEAMSDSEVEKYEKKIKDSLLRRDENLNTVGSALKEVMSGGVTVGGQTLYLHDFGISNLGYFNAAENEKNAFHIDGDPDDTDTSGNTDKLKTLIASDPDKVIDFFTGLSRNLYDKMNKLSASVNGYRTFGSFYDDKKMKSDYDDYKTKIKEMEDKLNDYEDKWYKKFSKMETAMAKMQSNSNAITGMLGGS